MHKFNSLFLYSLFSTRTPSLLSFSLLSLLNSHSSTLSSLFALILYSLFSTRTPSLLALLLYSLSSLLTLLLYSLFSTRTPLLSLSQFSLLYSHSFSTLTFSTRTPSLLALLSTLTFSTLTPSLLALLLYSHSFSLLALLLYSSFSTRTPSLLFLSLTHTPSLHALLL